MPLRVAERGGYIRAVNGCEDCPWRVKKQVKAAVMPFQKTDIYALFCGHPETLEKNDESRQIWPPDMFKQGCIPVWCPLPEPGEKSESPLLKLVNYLVKSKEEGSGMISEEQFEKVIKLYFQDGELRGKHPENIVWDEESIPTVFMVLDPGPPGFVVKHIILSPEYAHGPAHTYLRKDDCLTSGKDDYWICETPTSAKVKITQGQDLKKGDRLTIVSLARKEL